MLRQRCSNVVATSESDVVTTSETDVGTTLIFYRTPRLWQRLQRRRDNVNNVAVPIGQVSKRQQASWC